jgi:hypothetical protein
VEFRGVFTITIPLLIKPLEAENSYIGREAVQLISKLANHGEWQLDSITVQLIQTAKLSFVEPSQA